MIATKKLSVILLAHNVYEYVDQALDSILMQKVNFDFEIIVGDDGSQDGTADILMEYKKRYPDFIKLYLTPR